MRRKGVLDRFRHTDTSSKNHADAPLSYVKLDDPIPSAPLAAGSSAHNSQHISSQVPPWKLVPLPRHRDYPHHAVGIDDQVDRVIQLLEWENEANVAVILHGFGGTGKTTLADAVVARLDIQGWNISTLVSVPDESRHQGEMIQAQGEPEQASSFIYIDNFMVPGEHLRKLLPNNCKKLRLLVTARDEMVADVIKHCGIRTLYLYPVGSLLSQDACMELLCNKMGIAGTMQIPQIKDILKICDGVPLVLERVGAYICQSLDKDEAYRRVIQWSKDGNAFSNAEEYRIEKNGLVLDLDELPASAKEPFLDICSFFNGWDWDKVSCIMGEDVLNTLQKKALLLKREDCENKVTVRPIILTIGSMMTKGKRFTSVHDLNKVLEGSELDDIRGIKGIWLEDNISEPFLISAEKLDLMHESLRILALGDMTIVMGGQSCTQKFKQIIYFQAGLIPYIPFHPATLQELRFLDWLPDKNDDLQLAKMSSKLKVLILYGGRYPRRFETASIFGRLRGLKILKLIEFEKMKILHEELSLLTQLEELDLSGCGNLVQLPKRLGNLEALTKLSLRDCGSLQQLPDSFAKLQSLKCLDLHSCTSLEQLTQDFGSLKSLEELNLGEMSSLEELPSSFQKLSLLKVLNMDNCTSDLNHLPDNIRNLSLFVEIQVEGSRLESIPPRFQQVKYSFPVSVSMTDCSSLPREFCTYLKLVKDLSFRGCELLTNLPNQFVEFDSLARLDLLYCKSLESLPEGFGQLKFLTELDLEGCSSLQQLSADFHCLASLQSLNMRWCEKLQGKWMDSVVKIQTLDSVDIGESQMLLKRWAEIELEKKMGQQSWRFIVRTGDKELKNVENVLNMAASKLLSGDQSLLTDSRGEPFSLSTVAPNTLLLVMYDEEHENAWESPWRLLEEFVKHEHSLIHFEIIYVGKYFGQLSQSFADRIMACASHESEASLLLYKIQQLTSASYPHLLVTEVVLDEEGHKHFSKWKNIRDPDEFFLSKSKLYADLHKLTQPSVEAESNVKLLRALFADDAESTSSSVFVRSYTENIGVDQLYGKTVLLLISVMDEHPFQSLTEIYSKVKSSSDDLEILSIPIPVEVRGRPLHRSKRQLENMELPESDLAGFESILRNVPWPVLRNPWLLKIAVYYFIEREWGVLNPGILVVVNPNGRICSKNALPLVETWGSKVLPFSEEKMKQLEEMKQVEQESVEELLSECILNGLLEK